MKIVLKDERPASLNEYFARASHWRRSQLNERAHWIIKCALHELYWQPFKKPVSIIYTAYFDKRPSDPDNVLTKPLTDGMVLEGLLEDDSYRHIVSITTRSRIDRENPRVEILIEEVDHV